MQRFWKILTTTFLLIALLAGLGWWRLGRGPIVLDWLTPLVNQELARRSGNLEITVGGLSLQRQGQMLKLTTQDLRLSERRAESASESAADSTQKELVVLQDAEIELDYWRLGTPAPKTILLTGLSLHLRKSAAGFRLSLGGGEDAPKSIDEAALMRLLFPKNTAALPILSLVDARLQLSDETTQVSQVAEIDRLDLKHLGDSIDLKAKARLVTVSEGFPVEIEALCQQTEDTVACNLNVQAVRLTLGTVKSFWPEVAAPKVRSWLFSHVDSAELTNIGFRLPMQFPSDDPFGGDLSLAFDVGDMQLNYLPSMPPVNIERARAKLTIDSFVADVERAHSAGMVLAGTSVEIAPFSGEDTFLRLQANLQGSLEDSLKILNHEPISLEQKVKGLPLQGLTGMTRHRLDLRLPLRDDVRLADLAIKDEVKLEQVSSSNDVYEHRLNGNDGELTFSYASEKLDTSLRLAGIAHLAAKPWLGESFDVAVHYSDDASKDSLAIEVDLTNSTASAAAFGITKATAIPMFINLKSSTGKDYKVALKGDVLTGEGLLSFKDPLTAGQIFRLDLRELKAKGQDVTVKVARYKNGQTKIDLSGRQASLALQELSDLVPAPGGDPSTASHDSALTQLPQTLEIAIDRIDRLMVIETGVELAELTGNLTVGATTEIAFEARTPTGSNVAFSAIPTTDSEGEAGHHLQLKSADAAAVARLIGVDQGIERGDLLFVGFVDEQLRIRGNLKLSRFVLKDSPLIARLLVLGDLKQILNTLKGETGLLINRLEVFLDFAHRQLRLEKGKLRSANLAATLQEGLLNFEQQSIKAAGTLMPLGGVSQLVNHLPLGRWLTDSEGRGLMGMDFTVGGTIPDPDVSVNPLTAIAPHFLRDLLGM